MAHFHHALLAPGEPAAPAGPHHLKGGGRPEPYKGADRAGRRTGGTGLPRRGRDSYEWQAGQGLHSRRESSKIFWGQGLRYLYLLAFFNFFTYLLTDPGAALSGPMSSPAAFKLASLQARSRAEQGKGWPLPVARFKRMGSGPTHAAGVHSKPPRSRRLHFDWPAQMPDRSAQRCGATGWRAPAVQAPARPAGSRAD